MYSDRTVASDIRCDECIFCYRLVFNLKDEPHASYISILKCQTHEERRPLLFWTRSRTPGLLTAKNWTIDAYVALVKGILLGEKWTGLECFIFASTFTDSTSVLFFALDSNRLHEWSCEWFCLQDFEEQAQNNRAYAAKTPGKTLRRLGRWPSTVHRTQPW